MKTGKKARREAKQLFRLCLVNGLLNENRIRQTVTHILRAGNRDGRAILDHLLRLVRLDQAQHTANIESATPLPADLQEAIQAGLTRRYGPGLVIGLAHRASLIGGVRIQVGCDVFDGSVLVLLAALEKSF